MEEEAVCLVNLLSSREMIIKTEDGDPCLVKDQLENSIAWALKAEADAQLT